jgi:putative phage-type endonuclease
MMIYHSNPYSEDSYYHDYKNHKTWLAGRKRSIGASEAAAAIGRSRFQSPTDVYEEKVNGKIIDLSDNENAEYGKDAEEPLRKLFSIRHKNEYSVFHHPYRVYHHNERRYLTATPDGELIRIADAKKGVLEIKTVHVFRAKQLNEWENESIPEHYYIQILQELYATGFSFAVLLAEFRSPDGNTETREYFIDRADVTDDMQYVVREAEIFWKDHILKKQKPDISLVL